MAQRRKGRGVKHNPRKSNVYYYGDYEEKPRTQKHKRKRRGYSFINVLTILLFAVIMIYLAKYAFDFTSGNTSLGIETVDYGTIDIPNAFDGIVVRDEYVVSASKSGEPTFNYGEGDKVKKDAVVCTIREGSSAKEAEDKLQILDESIIETQKNRLDISKYKDDIEHIERNISSSVSSAQMRIAAGNYNEVYALRNSVQTQIDIRNNIWINENSEGSDSLAGQRQTYQTQITKSTENLTAGQGGILVLSCDEAEEKFTPDTIDTITEDDIKASYNIKYLSKTTAVDAQNPVFKIIKSNDWYICAFIDNSIAADWDVDDEKTIKANIDKSEKSVSVKISSMTSGESKTFVVFKSNRGLQDFLSVRTIEFYITDSSYEGLKIPNSAIIEKTFIKVPVGCVVESLDGKCVVKRTNGEDEIVNITIETEDDQFAYIRQDFDLLKIGDTILQGTGETATEYKLSEVSTKVGVLTANGAYAKFATISVMGQNSQYTIADPTKSSLKAYDKIISNASSAQEGDEVY